MTDFKPYKEQKQVGGWGPKQLSFRKVAEELRDLHCDLGQPAGMVDDENIDWAILEIAADAIEYLHYELKRII